MPWSGRAGEGSTGTSESGCGLGAVCCHFTSPGSKPEKRPGDLGKKKKEKKNFLTYEITFMPMFWLQKIVSLFDMTPVILQSIYILSSI